MNGGENAPEHRLTRDGTLLQLPVPLGTTVWRVQSNPACDSYAQKAEIFCMEKWCRRGEIIEAVPFTLAMLDDWGKTVFATKDEGVGACAVTKRKGSFEMDPKNEKCVMVIDESLPLGLIANTAAILGITIGMKMPEVVGGDVTDQSGRTHLGIIEFPVPILRAEPDDIRQMREKLYEPEFADLTVADFSDLAQGCKTYDEFIDKMARVPENSLRYLGVAVCGPKKKVSRLTGHMPLLR